MSVRGLASLRFIPIPGRVAAWAVWVCVFGVLAGSAVGAAERFEFTRMVAHWRIMQTRLPEIYRGRQA